MAMKHLPQAERLLSGNLSALLSDIATTMTVSNPPSASRLPTFIELDPDSADDRETVRAVSVSGNIVTIERGVYDGGTGKQHLSNAPYKEKITQKHWDGVVDALEAGYLPEDASLTFTRNSTSQFRVNGVDNTAYYTKGRRVRINGSTLVTVVSSSYSGGNTVVTTSETTVPTPITSVEIEIGPNGFFFELLDEDDMASDSDMKAPTQQSTKAYVDTEIAAAVAGISADSITLVAAPGADGGASGLKVAYTAGEDLVLGDVCYFKSDGKMWKANADAIATASVIGIALATIATDASGTFLLIGVVRNDAWNWTVGGLIYLSTTAGGLTQTAPSAADDVIQILGVATHADRMYFNPQLVQVEHI